MSSREFERPFPVPKEVLDTVNSISWFFLDAFWMLGVHKMAVFFVMPTALTGLLLLYIEKRRPVFFINMAINCWIWMNSFWMFSEIFDEPDYLWAARALFGAGVLCVGLAAVLSKNLADTFSHFKRFRIIKF